MTQFYRKKQLLLIEKIEVRERQIIRLKEQLRTYQVMFHALEMKDNALAKLLEKEVGTSFEEYKKTFKNEKY